MQEPAPGVRLQHRKSKTFVSEVVDQTHVIMMQTNDGGAQVSITFSRDCMDVQEEVFKAGNNPGELILTVDPEHVDHYRVQMMQAVMPLKAAFALALLQSVNQVEAAQANAAAVAKS
ncbi:hypothetical protein [Pseudomonas asiatica]|uniref:hypothetical protein n=1 Tax=Pseudomonas asiatica TaxID=2219225 RepID=UPI0010BF9FE5|nr:hypothetical protein [Pseudomonas asiatica]